MSALEILKSYKNEGVDFSDILRDPVNLELLNTLERFAHLASRYGYFVQVCSSVALKKLREVPEDKRKLITASFKTWCNFIEPTGSGPITENLEEIEEKFLRRALDYYGLHMSEDFWKTLERDSLIEIYGQDMVQLYRSLNFFKFSGYSLLDLSVFEWYVLWERPSRVNDDMVAHAKEALGNFTSIKNFNTPNHVLRETYNTGKTEPFVPRAIYMQFKHIGSLTGSAIHGATPRGFVCTSKAQVLAEGADALNIQFV